MDAYHAGNVRLNKTVVFKNGLTEVPPSSHDFLFVISSGLVGFTEVFQNHSCDPNCWISPVYINEPDDRKPILVLFTRVEVKPWEELCFSYFGPPSDDEGEGEAESVVSSSI